MISACSVGWFVLLLVREEVLLAGLCERKILFRLKIYDRLRQATAKRTGSFLDKCIAQPPLGFGFFLNTEHYQIAGIRLIWRYCSDLLDHSFCSRPCNSRSGYAMINIGHSLISTVCFCIYLN